MRIVLVACFLAIRVWGCSCAVPPTGNPPCQSAWQFGAVFTGMVTEISDPAMPVVQSRPPDFPQRKVRIRIAEALLGLDSNQKEIVIETGMGGGDCGYGFRRGADYLVYAYKKSDGTYSTGICTPTRLLTDAAEDLRYFHSLSLALPTAEVRVTAWDVNGSWRTVGGRQELPSLPGTHVTISGPGVNQTAITDAAGRHVFCGIL